MNDNSQHDLGLNNPNQEDKYYGPVECLGKTFASDAERREYYLAILAEKLKDPEFRGLEGFPVGEDEAILELSDPPYYTACPNPWAGEMILEWEAQKSNTSEYYKEPFATDISEGKNDPLYSAHSYHTKVPPKAIAKFIKHYTNPGDIILDGFSGTGMTSIATQVVNLEQSIKNNNDYKNKGLFRKCMTNDLAPIGGFITRGLLSQVASTELLKEANRIVDEVEKKHDWLYQISHSENGSIGVIDYVVWSDSLSCSECASEIDAYDAVVDRKNKILLKEFPCPFCGVTLKKRDVARVMESKIDLVSGDQIRQPKQHSRLVQYKVQGKRYQSYSEGQTEIQQRAYDLLKNMRVPTVSMEDTWRYFKDGNHIKGYSDAHHFYTYRNLLALLLLRDACLKSKFKNEMLFILTGFVDGHANRRNRYLLDKHHPEGTTCGPLSNSLFVAELQCEVNVFMKWRQTFKKQMKAWSYGLGMNACIQTGSSTNLGIPDSCIDYIFVDPPFGKNIIYSDLNIIYEHWLCVATACDKEAIVNEHTGKDISDYGVLMQKCFTEFYRVLKPGRWITLEFHNSLNAVWNSMQEALSNVGFVVADVRALDKKHGTIHQDSGYTVKQDLIVSAYKPSDDLERNFELKSGNIDGVWEFVGSHLKKVVCFEKKAEKVVTIKERLAHRLFDRMVGFHVQRGIEIPISFAGFYKGLNRYPKRDEMYFLPEQVSEYEKKRLSVKEVMQLELAVSDEESAIQWIRQQLEKKPLTFPELQPLFMKERQSGWQKYEKEMELSELLRDNFLDHDGTSPIPAQILSWLKKSEIYRESIKIQKSNGSYEDSKGFHTNDAKLLSATKGRWFIPDPQNAAQLIEKRNRALLREFAEYTKFTGKKLKEFRLEVLKAGFFKAWQDKDYKIILSLAEKIPLTVIQNDSKLMAWVDNSGTRASDESLF